MRKAKLKRFWLLLLLFFCLFQTKTYASIPNPTDNYYLDELNLLDDNTKENINKTNRQLEDKTGSQVVVMTLDNPENLEGAYYGTEIFNAWKIGNQKKDNGVLILLLMSDKEGENQINIITGYGIEGRLNDGKIGRIIDTFMLDNLRNGDYSTALNEGFNAVVGEIAAEYDIKLEKDYKTYDSYLDMIKNYDQEMTTYYDLRESGRKSESFSSQISKKQGNSIKNRNKMFKTLQDQGFILNPD